MDRLTTCVPGNTSELWQGRNRNLTKPVDVLKIISLFENNAEQQYFPCVSRRLQRIKPLNYIKPLDSYLTEIYMCAPMKPICPNRTGARH